MRTNLSVLAVAALLVVGTGSVVAAAMDDPTADTSSADALPSNYTVETIGTADLSDEELATALEIAWANEDVRSYVDDGTAVHFEVWTSDLDDSVHVNVAPEATPDDTRVLAEVDLDQQTVTTIDEPVELNASSAITIDASDYNLTEPTARGETTDGENATRLTAEQSQQIQLNETTIDRGGDGTFTIEVEDCETSMVVPQEAIVRIDLPQNNTTIEGQ